MPNIKEVKSIAEIEDVASLAAEIWNEHYIPIIGKEQVNYMVSLFQSVATIESQIEEGYQYFLVEYDDNHGGYFAILKDRQEKSMFLSKLYVHKDFRGHGIAKACVSYIEDMCRESGLTKIWLTVNKYNEIAIEAYTKMGFINVAAITQDIGNGFIMDDYKMEKTI